MRTSNAAFQAKLQGDGGTLVELIDLETTIGGNFHWTTCNQPVTYTLSGVATVYEPFPGSVPRGIEESSDLGVAVIDFIVANTGDLFKKLLESNDFGDATLKVGRVFVDTPDLHRMPYYEGKIGDFSYDRKQLMGQARNQWKSLGIKFPYYNYQDKCAWRFGGTGCGFNTASVTLSVATLNASSSSLLILVLNSGALSSYSAGRFDFGRLTITGGVNSGQVRTIRTHTGDMLGLSHPLAINSYAGMTLSIFPGCRKRLKEDCTSTYNNAENFLGFPWIPIQEQAF